MFLTFMREKALIKRFDKGELLKIIKPIKQNRFRTSSIVIHPDMCTYHL